MDEREQVAYRFNAGTVEVSIRAADGQRVVLTDEEADGYMAAVVAIEKRFFGDTDPDTEVVLSPEQEQAWRDEMDAVALRWIERVTHRVATQRQGGLA